MKAILYLKERGKITNSEYQELNNISKRTTSNDLTDLVEKYNLLRQLGASVSTYYELK
ncbi:DeoR family transcriptional regulator [Capnocytophaga sputigena]|uniref:DeoR family transcriptional regulator n=1 Tax=Capnocytophaga sputigena TaxID=1019 RepID=UPI0028E4D558|nr:DeoR family transcriptional regulator [Capnocytophaga sputigena]